jgi:hypothetical protein
MMTGKTLDGRDLEVMLRPIGRGDDDTSDGTSGIGVML